MIDFISTYMKPSISGFEILRRPSVDRMWEFAATSAFGILPSEIVLQSFSVVDFCVWVALRLGFFFKGALGFLISLY